MRAPDDSLDSTDFQGLSTDSQIAQKGASPSRKAVVGLFVCVVIILANGLAHPHLLLGLWRYDDPQILDFVIHQPIFESFYQPQVWRTLGLPFVEKVVRRSIIEKYDHFMEHQGTFVSFILFLIPGFPKDSLCYIMGLSHMKTSTFVVIATVGRLFGTLGLSVGGNFARDGQGLWLLLALGAVGLVLLAAYLFRDRWFRFRKKG